MCPSEWAEHTDAHFQTKFIQCVACKIQGTVWKWQDKFIMIKATSVVGRLSPWKLPSRRCLAVYSVRTGGALFVCTNKHMYTNTHNPTQSPLAFFSVIRCQRTALRETLTYFYQLSLGAGRTWKSSCFLPLHVYDRKEGPDPNFSDNTALKGRRGYVLTFLFIHSVFLLW